MVLPSGEMSKTSGSWPLWNLRTTAWVARSTTPMPSAARSAGGSFDSSTPGPAIGDPDSATRSSLPSRERRIPRGRLPTAMRCTTDAASGSMPTTLPPVSSETYSRTPDEGVDPAAGGEAGGVVAVVDAGGDDRSHAPNATVTHTSARADHLVILRIASSVWGRARAARSERNRVASLLQFFDVDPGYLAHAVEVREITVGFAILGDRIRIFLREAQNNDDVLTLGSIDVHTPADTKQVLLGCGEVVGGPFGPAI